MVAASALAVWVAAFLIQPTSVGPKPDREREGLRGPVQSVFYLGARSYNPGTGGAEADLVFDRQGWLLEARYGEARSLYQRNVKTGQTVIVNLGPDGRPTGVRTVVSFDARRQEVVEERTDKFGLIGRTVQRINGGGNIVERVDYYGNPPGSIRHRSRFGYDNQGRMVKAIEWDPHGPDKATVLYKYDAAGQVAEESWFNEDGTLRGTTGFTYKLDSHGNWLERTSQLCGPGAKPDRKLGCSAPTTETRAITHYEGGR